MKGFAQAAERIAGGGRRNAKPDSRPAHMRLFQKMVKGFDLVQIKGR